LVPPFVAPGTGGQRPTGGFVHPPRIFEEAGFGTDMPVHECGRDAADGGFEGIEGELRLPGRAQVVGVVLGGEAVEVEHAERTFLAPAEAAPTEGEIARE